MKALRHTLRESVMKARPYDPAQTVEAHEVRRILREGTPDEVVKLTAMMREAGVDLEDVKSKLLFVDLDATLFEISSLIGFVQEHGNTDLEWHKMTCKKILRDLREAADAFESSLK